MQLSDEEITFIRELMKESDADRRAWLKIKKWSGRIGMFGVPIGAVAAMLSFGKDWVRLWLGL